MVDFFLAALACGAVTCAAALLFVAVCRFAIFKRRSPAPGQPLVLGFFHPYCNSGGGGERVLWCALRALEDLHAADGGARPLRIVIYSGDVGVPSHQILARARDRFGVELANSKMAIEFVTVRTRALLEASRYPHFTMVGQSLGSMAVAWEALRACPPDIFVDTTGYAFSFFVAKWLCGCRVAAYVHYPTISTDMLQRVADRTASYNNDSAVARSPLRSAVKLQYYRAFAAAYAAAGRLADVVMVNSSWTAGHIENIWGRKPAVVFPPCDVASFEKGSLEDREPLAVSVGQFRPEKDHSMQLRAFAAMRALGNAKGTRKGSKGRGTGSGGDGSAAADDDALTRARLAIVGSCRGAEDEARAAALKAECVALGISDVVSFHLNVPFPELKRFLARGTVGLHTMWNEHFGIGVVEMMAAGVVTIAHDSGGPKLDIVTPFEGSPTGLLASDVDGYAAAMAEAFRSKDGMLALRQRARRSTHRFSDAVFHESFKRAFAPVLDG